ncbi:MAG: hypothetical protein WDO19_15305 [Bacteroidota bacterium]
MQYLTAPENYYPEGYIAITEEYCGRGYRFHSCTGGNPAVSLLRTLYLPDNNGHSQTQLLFK